jgi:sRNA-binding carbon storage regulator CsrA
MYVDLKINDMIKIGDIVIKLLDKSGRLARIAVDAPPSQPVTVNKALKATHDQRA